MTRTLMLAALLALAGCAAPLGGTARPECIAYKPIRLSEGAIEALRPFRADREQIAAHNMVWRERCG